VIEVRRPRDEDELAAALRLREEVFCGEQGVTLEGERDGLDEQALHLVAIDDDGAVLGTCRVLLAGTDAARLGRLCVRREGRGGGAGTALLAEAEREARAAGAPEMDLHAQTSALGLYRTAGYVRGGDPFQEEGIEHVLMRKALA
jgi:ElaA protein